MGEELLARRKEQDQKLRELFERLEQDLPLGWKLFKVVAYDPPHRYGAVSPSGRYKLKVYAQSPEEVVELIKRLNVSFD